MRRMAETRRTTDLVGVDLLAVTAEIERVRGDDGALGEAILEPELGKLLDAVGMNRNPDAERFELSRGFINLRTKAVGMELKRRGQSADAAADDRYVHN